MGMDYVTQSAKETQKLGENFAREILLRRGNKKAIVIALEGELGAGKTTFTQGFAKALGIKGIRSPTFVLMKSYKLKAKSYKLMYHIDCYRAKDHRDLETLGLKEVFSEPSNIVLIEWAERVIKILPKDITKVHIDHLSLNNRKIIIT